MAVCPPKRVLRRIRNIEQLIRALTCLIDLYERTVDGWMGVSNKHKQRLMRRDRNPCANDVKHMAHRKMGGHQKLMTTDVG